MRLPNCCKCLLCFKTKHVFSHLIYLVWVLRRSINLSVFVLRRFLSQLACIMRVKRKESVTKLRIFQTSILIFVKHVEEQLHILELNIAPESFVQPFNNLLRCYPTSTLRVKNSESVNQVKVFFHSELDLRPLQYLSMLFWNGSTVIIRHSISSWFIWIHQRTTRSVIGSLRDIPQKALSNIVVVIHLIVLVEHWLVLVLVRWLVRSLWG